MKSLADGLPPEIARQVHPDWRRNEAAYWAARDQLLSQYQGQWIGFADGAVIASGTSPVAVFHAAEASGRNPFVTCVGREDEPTRMRRVSFAYDGSYPGEPLPILNSGIPSGKRFARYDLGSSHCRHWGGRQHASLGRLSRTSAHRCPGEARLDGRCRGRHGANPSLSCLGLPGWTTISVPTASGLHWPRTHP